LALQGGITKAHADTCELKNPAEAIAAVRKDPSLNYFSKITAELNIRKAALKEVVACAVVETQAPKSKLNEFQPVDKNVKLIQGRFDSELGNTIDHYTNQNARIDDLGLLGAHDFASELRTWRMNNALPLITRTLNLIMFLKNQALLDTAQSRVSQVSQTVKTLKIVDAKNVSDIFTDAQSNLQKAQDATNAAQSALAASGDPNDALSSTKESLASLAGLYKNLFDISDAVNKILPRQ